MDRPINWEGVLDRLIEETGAKNARELDEIVDAPTNYSYQVAKRGMSKGYMEKVINNYGNVDWNYIIKGKRTTPVRHTKGKKNKSPEYSTNQLIDLLLDAMKEEKEVKSEEQFNKTVIRLIRSLTNL